jgi:serine/threonine protein kinase/tetratricopeptide (TPR) repeat protein
MKRLPPDLLELASARLLAVPESARAAECEELAAQNPQWRDELLRLARRLAGAERLLDQSFPSPRTDHELLDRLGYRVVRQLGEGAFGIVYLCEQQRPIARLVAIKVLRQGAGDGHTLARFRAEQQVLAAMSHPTITPIHDAGHLSDGRPFFVMEFVDGSPFAEFCRTRALTLDAALRLFVRVCRGVEYAHSRGIVHRDLKPANVLVADGSAEPEPKIIDFGIAKALTPEHSARAGSLPSTDVGRVLGTPGYMSPEQAAGRTADVDARADVFALGVMLYECLTGRLPWQKHGLGDADDRSDPPLPSRRILTGGAAGTDSTTARRIAARVRGDLDWITAKALCRDPKGRYPSAREFADDLDRHLAHRPVLARPPALRYRLRRLVRRHRVAAGALFVAALLSAGIATLVWRERATARANQREAQAIADRLLDAANGIAARTPQSDPVRHALADEARALCETWLSRRPDDPALRARRARALLTMCEVHTVLGEVEHADRIVDEVRRETEFLTAATPGDVGARGLRGLAVQQQVRILHLRQQYEDSLPLCVQVIADLTACSSVEPLRYGPALARALREQAIALSVLQQHEPSLTSFRAAIDALEDLLARGMPAKELADDLVMARMNLGAQFVTAGRLDDAEAELARCEAELSTVVEARERVSATVLCQFAQIAARRGDFDLAAARYARGLAACEEWVQREPQHVRAHVVRFEAARQIAELEEQRGEFAAATIAMQRAVGFAETWLAAFSQDRTVVPRLRLCLYGFARTLWNRFDRDDLPLAATWLARCDELWPRLEEGQRQRPHPWEVHSVAAHVADADGSGGETLWEALAVELPRLRELGAEEPVQQVVEAWVGVARSRGRRSDFDGASAALDAAAWFVPADDRGPVDQNLRAEMAFWRARIAGARGRWSEAAAALDEIVRRRPSWWGHWRAGDGAWAVADALAREGSHAAAARSRERAVEHYRAVVDSLAAAAQSNPTDPWRAVPHGLCAIGLALADAERGETSAAKARAVAALVALAKVEADAHCDLWDAARIAAGRELVTNH